MMGADGRPRRRLAMTHTSPPPLSPSPSRPAPLPPSPPLAAHILIEAGGGNVGPLLWLAVGLGLAGCCCCCSLLLLALARRHRNRHTVSTVLTGSGCSTAIRQDGSHADSSRYLPRDAAQLTARARLWRHILGGSGGEHTRCPPVATAADESATLQELISAAATSLALARQAMASEGRDDTPPLRPSSQPALQCFASTLHRHSRQGSPSGRFPGGRHPSFRPPHTPNKRTTTLPQSLVRHNGRLFQATQHESTGQRGPPASLDDPHLSPTNASISRSQAMDWLSDALELVEGVQSRDVSPEPSFKSSPSCGELPQASPQLPPKASPQLPRLLSLHSDFGRNSEFHPMPLAANQQSSRDLAAQNFAPTTPPGMAVASPRKNSRTRTLFPSLGFRLVWNDAAPNASQDAESTFGEYERVRTLGKGSFGTAVLLRHRRTGHMVVSKQVAVQEMERADLGKVNPPARPNLSPDPDPNPSHIPNPNQVENEVRILSSLAHAHIITYHCSFQVKLAKK